MRLNAFSLSLLYLKRRLMSTVLAVITFSLGIALISLLLLANHQLQEQVSRNFRNIDLVVGAKGSPLQLILSSVFHMDAPTGNIPLTEMEKLKQNPLIGSVIPLALGDNFNGYRIVGTTPAYVQNYEGSLAKGRLFDTSMEAVVGAEVAAHYPLSVGSEIVGAHGLVDSKDLHSDFPYKVVGILNPTGTVLDRLVLTPVESVWHVHEHPDADDPEEVEYKATHPEKEVTALLIHYKTPLAAVSLPRMINTTTGMIAASPAFEMARLNRFVGVGVSVLTSFGWLLIILAGLSNVLALSNAMYERRYDIALMRSLGISSGKIMTQVMLESVMVIGCGLVLGLLIAHGVLLQPEFMLSNQAIAIATTFLPEELWLILLAVLMGVGCAVIPLVKIYKVDLFKTLVKQ